MSETVIWMMDNNDFINHYNDYVVMNNIAMAMMTSMYTVENLCGTNDGLFFYKC